MFFTVLHPGLKLEYFRKQEWDVDWIENAELITRNVFDDYRGFGPDDGEGVTLVNEVCFSVVDEEFEYLFCLQEEDNDFGNICVGNLLPDQLSEMDKYLRADIVKVANPLKWWTDNVHVYPQLSRMALDYLSIPGKFQHYIVFIFVTNVVLATSTAVERVFSQGRQLLHFTRNRLSGSCIRSHLCLGSWFCNDMVGISELDSVVKGTSLKRKQSDKSLSSEIEVVDLSTC